MRAVHFLAMAAMLSVVMPCQAALLTINPTSDGSIYTCPGCLPVADSAYVLAAGSIEGIVKFSTAEIRNTPGDVRRALLSLNPYGLPLWDATVEVYGYGTSIGSLVASDGQAGTLLGTLALPMTLGYGQDAFFDVTDFVAATTAMYLAFNLRTSDVDVFSSLEYNYGHPAQLLVAIPVPPSIALLGLGLAGLGWSRCRK